MPRGKQSGGLLTQQKVLRAAVALFLEKGYTKTTTGEIARAAGIGQSSFFHVFPSKEALLLELVRRMFDGQFALAEQHSREEDLVFLYGNGFAASHCRADRVAAGAICNGIFVAHNSGLSLSQHSKMPTNHLWHISAWCAAKGFL